MPAASPRTGSQHSRPRRRFRAGLQRAELEEHLAAASAASYDLFGNGKTAVKASAGRYLEAPLLISFTRVANPAGAISTNATRNWGDANGDFLPQASELGPLNNVNFGMPVINTRYGEDIPTTRGYNWEVSTSVQHELMARVSMNVGYFRRWYGNVRVNDNLRVTPADYSPYCVTAPSDSRLPGGGGYQICGLYDISVAKFGQVDTLVRLADDFGEDKEIYNGVDVSLNARLPRGVVVQGGTSTGRTLMDSCYVIDSPGGAAELQGDAAVPDADQGDRRLPAALGRRPDVRDVPEPARSADQRQPRVQQRRDPPTLGRNLASCGVAATCNGNATVQMIDPGTMYGARLNQVDFRLSKIFRMAGGRRVQANVDLFNLFNVSAVLATKQHLRAVLATSDEHHPGASVEAGRADRLLGSHRTAEDAGRAQRRLRARLTGSCSQPY